MMTREPGGGPLRWVTSPTTTSVCHEKAAATRRARGTRAEALLIVAFPAHLREPRGEASAAENALPAFAGSAAFSQSH